MNLRADYTHLHDESPRHYLLCPHCRTQGIEQPPLHHRAHGGDHTAVTVHPDRDAYDSPIGTRGGWVQIDLECASCGHLFSLVIANHKGQQIMGCVDLDHAQSAAARSRAPLPTPEEQREAAQKSLVALEDLMRRVRSGSYRGQTSEDTEGST